MLGAVPSVVNWSPTKCSKQPSTPTHQNYTAQLAQLVWRHANNSFDILCTRFAVDRRTILMNALSNFLQFSLFAAMIAMKVNTVCTAQLFECTDQMSKLIENQKMATSRAKAYLQCILVICSIAKWFV